MYETETRSEFEIEMIVRAPGVRSCPVKPVGGSVLPGCEAEALSRTL